MSIPIPRKFDGDFSAAPRHWVADNAVATAIVNGLSMLFPHGERFFVRSVHFYLDKIDDPQLRDQVKAFFKQEGHHAAAHDDYNAVLRKHGFEIDRFLERWQRFLSWLEGRLPAKLSLAGTAAAEHFTAILAEGAFDGELDNLDPSVRLLMAWHAAEEIEHKAVAFDVLQQVDPSYAVRITGLALATAVLATFWLWSAGMLVRQEKLSWRQLRRELGRMRGDEKGRRQEPVIRRVFAAGIRQYLRRDFHPRQNANEHLAAEWFRANGQSFVSPSEPAEQVSDRGARGAA